MNIEISRVAEIFEVEAGDSGILIGTGDDLHDSTVLILSNRGDCIKFAERGCAPFEDQTPIAPGLRAES